jgi:hypothetical protein
MYLAQNVIFNQAAATGANAKTVDKTTQILASDILLSDPDAPTAVGRLKSTDLKAALANEVAVDAEKMLTGHTWKVDHKIAKRRDEKEPNNFWKHSDAIYKSGATFNADGTIDVENCLPILGDNACASADLHCTCSSLVESPTYQFVNNSIMIVTYTVTTTSSVAGDFASGDNDLCKPAPANRASFTHRVTLQVVDTANGQAVLFNPQTGEVAVLTQ